MEEADVSVRLFFATDVHGSETCWRKFLNSGKHYEADVLILGGDMTGKALVPIMDNGGGKYNFHACRMSATISTAPDALAVHQRAIRDHGYYPVVMTPEQREKSSRAIPTSSTSFSIQQMRRTVEEWVAWADERLAGTGMRCIVCPGNDDRPDIDELLASSSQIEVGEGNVVDRPRTTSFASSGWTNLTPWDTPRER